MTLNIVIMAAGKGTRMKSERAKVLLPLAGRPLLQHVLECCVALEAQRIVAVTGYGADAVEASIRPRPDHLRFVRQEPQLGTGHAVQQALPALIDDDEHGITLILNGDTPLVQPATARALIAACGGERLALLTVELPDATGYGRVVRESSSGASLDHAPVRAVVEHRDASDAERRIREVYTGMMAAPTRHLERWLARLSNDNAQKEYYLTDVVSIAVASGVPVVASTATDVEEVLGVNSPAQLADLERRVQRRRAEALMDTGVRLADPARFDQRGELTCGRDVEIDVGCIFEGRVELGDGVVVGAHCLIRDARVAAGAIIHPFTHIDGANVGAGARIGPYARLRPGAELAEDVHIGNFVEVKNSALGPGAKANHLAYLGDATVGARVNVGAGSITANYDGARKHRTVIGDDASIGSNCVLVAPVTVGAGATIGGGSTIGKDAPPGQLTVARARQVTVPGWKRPVKAK
jgi:bifunctional UDP-N-acetylglucosamine pyrophosphorylase/glucosamine-1-phosphate N-acetyltransferase